MIWETLDKKLILIDREAASEEDIFREAGGLLIQGGYCRESYIQALTDREKEYPTGLNINGVGVAIPHTDVSHVVRPAMAVAILKKPVTFEVMGGDEGENVDVSIVVVMAIQDPAAHLDQVKALLKILQDSNVLRGLMSAESKEEVIQIIKGKEEKL